MTRTLTAGALRWSDIAELTSAAGYPCVSVLLSTTPGPRMAPADVTELGRLVDRAATQLDSAGYADSRIRATLRRLARDAARRPAGTGLGIFVSRDVERTLVLPVGVRNRAVVEPSFATRDLMRALHRTPPHLVLALYPSGGAFFQCQGNGLVCVGQVAVSTSPVPPDHEQPVPGPATEALFEEVDARLGKLRTEFPSPLVIAGSAPLVDAFCFRSEHLHRLAGRVTDAETPEDVQQHAARVLEEYLQSRGREALAEIERTATEQPHLLATGLEQAWERVHDEAPRVLAVEHGFASPGHHFATVSALDDPEGPVWLHDLVDDPYYVEDLVDDLVEVVVNRGGWVAFVDDGALAGHGRVALVCHG